MNTTIANAMSGYIETLYYVNKNLITLCGSEIFGNGNFEKLVLDILQDIPRLIPFKCNITNQIELESSDGLLEYENDLSYLRNDYQNILNSNYDIIDKARKIRNKYEHKMHNIQYNSSGRRNTGYFDIVFDVNGSHIQVYASELISLIKGLNDLFSKIVFDMSTFAYQNSMSDYPYYHKFTRFEFKDFNELYESTLLHKIGKIMNDF